ncbi:MAG: LysM peptidoglycan-binding domain-containing protein [Anaerolineae bacterium]|nr:LysM peptidoglycan-binding domain-containing protein [Anaerolineae bacterium]
MSTTRGGLEPALIVNQDTGDTVRCMFNPNEYTLTKQNRWERGETKGKNVPRLKFSQGGSQTLKLQLFFDTYAEGVDVREHTDPLWEMMMVNADKTNPRSNKSEPPAVSFQWGGLDFSAVITNMTQKYTLFLKDGTPVRTTVDITLEQLVDEGDYPRQNPTSGGGDAHKTRVVQSGERIDLIAYQEYDDAAEWRRIAEANGLVHPLRLRPGQQLTIPPLI